MRNAKARRRFVLTQSLIAAGLVTAVAGSLGSGACTVFDTEPVLSPDASAGSSGSGGSGGTSPIEGPWWQKKNEQGCVTAGFPRPEDRPAPGLDGPDEPEFFMNMEHIRLGATAPPSEDLANHLSLDFNSWKDIGLDVDGKCTLSATCGSEASPVEERYCPSPPGQGRGDGSNCRDNAVGTTIKTSYEALTTSTHFAVNEEDWNCELHRGGFGVLCRIRNYNGQPDDPQVTLDVYNHMGLTALQRPWCRFLVNSSGVPVDDISRDIYPYWRNQPKWDDTRAGWRVATSNWNPGDDTFGPNVLPNSKTHTEQAYVREGYLVAHLPPSTMVGMIGKYTAIPGFRLIVERGVLVGQLLKDPFSRLWTLKNGVLGGAIDPDTMLQGFRWIGYCPNNMCGSYRGVDIVLRGAADIYLDPTRPPSTDPSQPCDGMSIGLALEATQARGAEFSKEEDPLLTECPEPRHPTPPRQACTCPDGGSVPNCPGGDGGTDAGDDAGEGG